MNDFNDFLKFLAIGIGAVVILLFVCSFVSVAIL